MNIKNNLTQNNLNIIIKKLKEIININDLNTRKNKVDNMINSLLKSKDLMTNNIIINKIIIILSNIRSSKYNFLDKKNVLQQVLNNRNFNKLIINNNSISLLEYNSLKGGTKLNSEFKKEYLEECREILNSNNIKSRDYLLDKLREDVYNEVKQYSNIEHILSRDLEIIFSNIDLNDENNIGIINIVSLQCAVLFTYASLNFEEPTEKDFCSLENPFRSFIEFINKVPYKELDKNPDKDWRYYTKINKRSKTWEDLYNRQNGLIIILDYLTLDEVIQPYLDLKFYCGLIYKKSYANGRNMLPFGFIEHDIVHFNNFEFACLQRMGYNIREIQKLYNFIMSIENKKMKYSAKLIFFINIHENFCDIYSIRNTSLKNSKSSFYSGALRQGRFLSDNNLGLLIPRYARNNEENRLNYLQDAYEIYIKVITQFKEGKKKFIINNMNNNGVVNK